MHSENVVLDTNVVIAAAISKERSPANIFMLLLQGKIRNFTSNDIIEEVKATFGKKRIRKYIQEKDAAFIIKEYVRHSILIEPKVTFIVQEDPDDNKFVECAISADADYIISGDKHLLNLKVHGIEIVTPHVFLVRIR